MKLVDQHIVITSNEPWGDTWYSKQNYAWELARHNTVYFIDPPKGFGAQGLFGAAIESRSIHDRLHVVTYNNARPVRTAALYAQNNRIVSRRLGKWLAERGAKDFLFWSFDPYRLSDPQLLGAGKTIFHAVDQYDFIPYGEEALVRRADLVICVADAFRAAYQPFNDNVRFLPHLISEEEFSAGDPVIRASLPPARYGLYIGNIDDRVDYGTVEKLLRKFPDIPFVFTGKLCFSAGNVAAKRIFAESSFHNLIVTGAQPFKALKHYIAGAAFCLAPMNRHHPGNTISHHKILQYLALGKPVFSCRFSAYDHMRDLLSMHDTDDTLLEALEHFLQNGEPETSERARIAFARQFTFAPAFDTIEGWLNHPERP